MKLFLICLSGLLTIWLLWRLDYRHNLHLQLDPGYASYRVEITYQSDKIETIDIIEREYFYRSRPRLDRGMLVCRGRTIATDVRSINILEISDGYDWKINDRLDRNVED